MGIRKNMLLCDKGIMVSNVELASKIKEMSKNYGTKIDLLEAHVKSLEAQLKSLTKSINALFQQQKFNREKKESSTVSKGMQKEPQPMETFNISDNSWEFNKGVKNHNIYVFLDWVHSLESFFKWHNINETQKFYFAESKLKGTAHVWWKKEQANF